MVPYIKFYLFLCPWALADLLCLWCPWQACATARPVVTLTDLWYPEPQGRGRNPCAPRPGSATVCSVVQGMPSDRAAGHRLAESCGRLVSIHGWSVFHMLFIAYATIFYPCYFSISQSMVVHHCWMITWRISLSAVTAINNGINNVSLLILMFIYVEISFKAFQNLLVQKYRLIFTILHLLFETFLASVTFVFINVSDVQETTWKAITIPLSWLFEPEFIVAWQMWNSSAALYKINTRFHGPHQ